MSWSRYPLNLVTNLHSLALEWLWWSQFSLAHLPDQVKIEFSIPEPWPKFKSLRCFRFNWTSLSLHSVTNQNELGDYRDFVRQATTCSFWACLRWGERLGIFVLPQFETVSLILLHYVLNSMWCDKIFSEPLRNIPFSTCRLFPSSPYPHLTILSK